MPVYSSITMQTEATALPWVFLPNHENPVPGGSFNVSFGKTMVSGHGDTTVRIEGTFDDPASNPNAILMAIAQNAQIANVTAFNFYPRAVRFKLSTASAPSDYTFSILAV